MDVSKVMPVSSDSKSDGSMKSSKQKAPAKSLTPLHVFYIFVWHGVGAMCIAGGANFGIATAMYRHSPHPVRLWNINDNTLAGDAAVTVFVELILAWIIDAAMVTNDVRQAALGISPLEWTWRRKSSSQSSSFVQKTILWYINCEGMDLLEPGLSFAARFRRLLGSAFRGLGLAVCAWFLWWPIGVGILAGIGTSAGGIEHSFNHWPLPQVFKLMFGGTMALFLVPLVAWAALLAMDPVRATSENDAVVQGSRSGAPQEQRNANV